MIENEENAVSCPPLTYNQATEKHTACRWLQCRGKTQLSCHYKVWLSTRPVAVHKGNSFLVHLTGLLTIFRERMWLPSMRDSLQTSICLIIYPKGTSAVSVEIIIEGSLDIVLKTIHFLFGLQFQPWNKLSLVGIIYHQALLLPRGAGNEIVSLAK